MNNVIFSNTVFGRSFGDTVLAVTTSWSNTSSNRFVEADMVFNTAFAWDSYRGNLRGSAIDIRRARSMSPVTCSASTIPTRQVKVCRRS